MWYEERQAMGVHPSAIPKVQWRTAREIRWHVSKGRVFYLPPAWSWVIGYRSVRVNRRMLACCRAAREEGKQNDY